MKGKNRLATAFLVLVFGIILVLGMIIGYKAKESIEEDGLCWRPVISYNDTTYNYELCIIAPPETQENAS